MNLAKAALNELEMTEDEFIARLELSNEQLSEWNTECLTLPNNLKRKILQGLGIVPAYWISWYDISHKQAIIEQWIKLIGTINCSADFPSFVIADNTAWYSVDPLITLMELGCAFPESPLSIEEFLELDAQDALPPFYRLLVAYFHEIGLKEKWISIHLMDPFAPFTELYENEDLLDEFYFFDRTHPPLTLRSMDKNLLKACGCSESALKKLISETEKMVSRQIKKITKMISRRELPLECDLSPYLKYNGYELLHPSFKTRSVINQQCSQTSND